MDGPHETSSSDAGSGRPPWYKAIWRAVDAQLFAFSKKLQRVVRVLRLIRFLLWFGVLVVLSSAIIGIVWPEYFPYAYAAAILFLVLPIIVYAVLVGLPLKMRSLVRLIDKGYPENARELAIRVFARKMRDQSIETEELLLETAVNESRKALRRFRERSGAGPDEGASTGPDSPGAKP